MKAINVIIINIVIMRNQYIINIISSINVIIIPDITFISLNLLRSTLSYYFDRFSSSDVFGTCPGGGIPVSGKRLPGWGPP